MTIRRSIPFDFHWLCFACWAHFSMQIQHCLRFQILLPHFLSMCLFFYKCVWLWPWCKAGWIWQLLSHLQEEKRKKVMRKDRQIITRKPESSTKKEWQHHIMEGHTGKPEKWEDMLLSNQKEHSSISFIVIVLKFCTLLIII